MAEVLDVMFAKQDFLTTFSSLFIIIFIGYGARKWQILPAETSKLLSTLMIKIIVPTLALTVFMRDIDGGTFQAGLGMFIFSLLLHVLILATGRFLYPKHGPEETIALTNMTAFSSNTLFGLPIIAAFLGETGVMLANIFNIPYRLIHFTYSPASMSQSSAEQKVDWRSIFLNGVTIATLLGFFIWVSQPVMPQVSVDGQLYSILRIDQTAEWLYRPLSLLSSLLSPVAWLLIGSQLAEMDLSDSLTDRTAWYYSGVKLIGVPLLTLGFGWLIMQLGLLPLESTSLAASTLTMAAPPSAMLIVFAIEGQCAVETVSAATLLSTLLSVVTLPLWVVAVAVWLGF